MWTRLPAVLQRPDFWLLMAVVLGAALRLSRLGDFDNQYYTATVVSMLNSPHNFLFGSFDPGGVVMVDKPPFSFWVQSIPVALFGPERWAVGLPQAVCGTLAIPLLYLVVKPVFGRAAAIAAALVLAVMPASVIIDSRNEPDSLLLFTLLLAALSIIRAAETGRWRWLIIFAVLMGIGFNIKMLAAFVPLPALLLYYLLAAKVNARQLVVRVALTLTGLLVVSFSWVMVVAFTPPEDRPYVGSTRDNSIGTLVFEYNGIDRFTSFIGPRMRQQQPAAGYVPTGQASAGDSGIMNLFSGRLSGQTGWLLPLALFMLLVSLASLLHRSVYRHPAKLFNRLRKKPAASQSVLWGGWLVTTVVVFGMADATTTHPYYLVELAVPLAAVTGIGYALLRRVYRNGGSYSWLLPAAIASAALYQAIAAGTLVAGWAVAALLVVAFMAVLVMVVAIGRKATATPLAAVFGVAGALSLLLVPGVAGMQAGGSIAGPNAGLAGLPAQQANPGLNIVDAVSRFVDSEGDAGSLFTVGTVNAREAAPFIIADVPAVAIGGFTGSDPIFSTSSFRAIAQRGELRYFLMPRQSPSRASPQAPRLAPQQAILDSISRNWEDVSRAAGLPRGTLYRYRAP
ncbi:ArnT family glycosyltransferase [Chloroflexota bacterium]